MSESRTFHPRLTNIGGGCFSAVLPLPCIPVALDEEEEPPRAPKASNQLLAKLSELLTQTDVSYL